MSLNRVLSKLRQELDLKRFEDREVQTEVDMNNLEFVMKAEKVYKSKTCDIKDFLKSLQKVRMNESQEEPMSNQEMIDLAQLILTKKHQYLTNRKLG